MKRPIENYLTLDKIAEQWAIEGKERDGRRTMSRDVVLLELLRAAWRGEFEDEDGNNTILTRHTYPLGGAARVSADSASAAGTPTP